MSTGNNMVTAILMFAGNCAAFSVHAGDVAAGKAKVEQACAECHRSSDWSGESAQALEALMKDIVSGKVKHGKRPIQLTSQEIADIAAYWTSGRK